MDNRQSVSILLLVLLAIVVTLLVGVGAFWLGRQSAPAAVGEINRRSATAVIIVTPTPLTTRSEPPPFVTNTPTLRPSPTPTFGPTATPTPSPTNTPTPTPTPIVVITHINALGRLETTEFAMRTTIDLGNDPTSLWQQLFGSDRVMLLAEGEVVAGFDLEKIRPADIAVNGTTVKIILPAPEILYSRIDNEKTQVYERETGLLVTPDQTLEGRARQLAEEGLIEWALQRQIFERAERDGRLQIENLLLSLGFENITIEVREPDL